MFTGKQGWSSKRHGTWEDVYSHNTVKVWEWLALAIVWRGPWVNTETKYHYDMGQEDRCTLQLKPFTKNTETVSKWNRKGCPSRNHSVCRSQGKSRTFRCKISFLMWTGLKHCVHVSNDPRESTGDEHEATLENQPHQAPFHWRIVALSVRNSFVPRQLFIWEPRGWSQRLCNEVECKGAFYRDQAGSNRAVLKCTKGLSRNRPPRITSLGCTRSS